MQSYGFIEVREAANEDAGFLAWIEENFVEPRWRVKALTAPMP
jgi:hypothetical protein